MLLSPSLDCAMKTSILLSYDFWYVHKPLSKQRPNLNKNKIVSNRIFLVVFLNSSSLRENSTPGIEKGFKGLSVKVSMDQSYTL